MPILLLILFSLSAHAQIEGQWLTEDKTGTIEIFKEKERFFGKIVGGTPRGDGLDRKNPNEKLRTREVMNLVILRDLKKIDDSHFADGKIYDPDSGNTYSCKLTLESPTKLTLRGFLGISLFGRSETWTKVGP